MIPSIQGMAPSILIPGSVQEVQRRPLVPAALDTMSTAKATPSSYKPTTPRLEPTPVYYRVIATADRLFQAGQTTVDLQAKEFKLEEQNLAELVKTHTQQLHEAAKRAQESGAWSYLQKIGSAVLSTISIFLGIHLGTAAATAAIGATLVAVGALGLAHLAFQEAGFWDWVAEKIGQDNEDLKRNIRTYAPFILGLLINGAQLAAFWAFPFYSSLDAPAKIFLVAQTIANSATIAAAVGGQLSEAFVAKAKADVLALHGELQLSQRRVDHITRSIEDALSTQDHAYKTAKSLIDLAIEANQQILSV